MTDTTSMLPNFTQADLPDQVTQADIEANRFTESSLEKHKREGLVLAVRARIIALTVIGIMLPFLNPSWDVLYYEVLLIAMMGVGWAQMRIGRVGRSSAELAVLFVDLALATFVLVFPNPFNDGDWPTAMIYRFDNFIYLFVILAAGTMAYSWRTITAIGNWTAAMWLIAAGCVWWFGKTDPELGAAAEEAFGHDPVMFQILNPNNVNFDRRIQEIVVFLIVSVTLAFSIRRFNKLILDNVSLLRERENLSRYFSPNVVEELSRNDEPLKQIRTHDVAVLFVDIVGFTEYAANRTPQEVIETLRGFHGRMEEQVFRHEGTLDKYLGDGLMATFGTPFAGDQDAVQALRCARAMIRSLAEWNQERQAAGEPRIKGSFGLHFGPVVLGDIGANRLEFAVIGNTVNVASRVEELTRRLSVELAISEPVRAQVIAESGPDEPSLDGLERQAPQPIRGLDQPVTVWTLK